MDQKTPDPWASSASLTVMSMSIFPSELSPSLSSEGSACSRDCDDLEGAEVLHRSCEPN